MKKSLLSLLLLLAMLVTAFPLAVSATEEPEYDYDSLYVQDGLDFHIDFFRSNEFWGENLTEGFDLTTKPGIDALLASEAVVVKTGSGKAAVISGKADTTTVTVQDGYLHFVKTDRADQMNFLGVVDSAKHKTSWASMEMVSDWGAVPGNHRIVFQDIRWLGSGNSFNGIQFDWGGYWPYQASGTFNTVPSADPSAPVDFAERPFAGQYANDPLGLNISAITSLSTMTWNLMVRDPAEGDADYEEGGWAFRHTLSGTVYGTGQAGGDKAFAAGRHDESFKMDLYLNGSVLDLNGEADGTTMEGTNDTLPASNPWNGGTPYIGYGGTIDVKLYSIRFYTKDLSEEEIRQNHFADLAKWFKLDMGAFASLTEDGRQYLYRAMQGYTLENTLLLVQEAYNKALGEAELYPFTTGLLSHEGYELALEGEEGMRAVFSVKLQQLLEAEKAGLSFEIGLFAADDGTPASSLVMLEMGDGSFLRGPDGKVKVFYTTEKGWTKSLATDGVKTDAYFQKNGKLCLSIGYRDEEIAKESAYSYRGYVIARKGDGAPIVMYYEENAEHFAPSPSYYDLVEYYLFEYRGGIEISDAPAYMKELVDEVAGDFLLDGKTIHDIADELFAVEAKAYEDITIAELKTLYMYQGKADHDPTMLHLMRRYHKNNEAVDLYQRIIDCLDDYSETYGSDIRNQFFLNITAFEKKGTGEILLTYEDGTVWSLGSENVRPGEGYNGATVTALSLSEGILTVTLTDSVARNTAEVLLGKTATAATVTVELTGVNGKLCYRSAPSEPWVALVSLADETDETALETLRTEIGFARQTETLGTGTVLAISGESIRFRATEWTAEHDLAMDAKLSNAAKNGNFNILNLNLVSKNAALYDVTSTAGLFKSAGDDITPLNFNGTYIGANHGYNIISQLKDFNDHGKTEADIGSIWAIGTQQYVLVKVDGSTLWFCPYSEASMQSGTFSPAAIASGAVITHVSGATNTASMTAPKASTLEQFYVATNHLEQRAFLDGTYEVDLAKDGSYTAEFVDFYEAYDIIYLPDMLTYLIENAGKNTNDSHHDEELDGSYVRIHVTYRYHKNGSCVVYSQYDFDKTVKVGYFGAVQSQPFAESTHYVYVPGTTTYAVPTLQGNESIYLKKNQLATAGKHITSYFQFSDAEGSKAMNLGFNPYYGYGTTEKRDDYLLGDYGFYYTSFKMYPYLISGGTVSAGESVTSVAYRVPSVKTDEDLTALNWYWVGEDIYLSLHTDAALDKTVSLPDYMEGMTISLVEGSDSFTVNSETISGGISVTATGAGYAIVKLTSAE